MPSRSFGLLLLCFFLSGLAALIYQTAWTRQFAFVFGTSELAVASVLAAYMGGLALGAAVVGRLAPRVRRPGFEPGSTGHEGLTDELIAHCREGLARFKIPRSIDYETELPRLPTGKLYKRLLRDRYWGKKSGTIV